MTTAKDLGASAHIPAAEIAAGTTPQYGHRIVWRGIVSPPAGFAVSGPDMNSDFGCRVEGERVLVSSWRFNGSTASNRRSSFSFAAGQSTEELLDGIAAHVASLGPVIAFTIGDEPIDDGRDGMWPMVEDTVLGIWCGPSIDTSDILVQQPIVLPPSIRLVHNGRPSPRIEKKTGLHPDEWYGEKAHLSQLVTGEWVLTNDPHAVVREIHAHNNTATTLHELVEWASAEFQKAIDPTEHPYPLTAMKPEFVTRACAPAGFTLRLS